jgi:hypothetical protein
MVMVALSTQHSVLMHRGIVPFCVYVLQHRPVVTSIRDNGYR